MAESRELGTLKPDIWTSQILDFDPFNKKQTTFLLYLFARNVRS